MGCNIVCVLGLLFLSRTFAHLSDFVHLEYDGGDIAKPKPPVLAQRDGRFIRFDTSDTEIELELGVSVPFLKIPLHPKSGVDHSSDHKLTINPAGLLVGATLLLTSFLLVPWAFSSHGHRKRQHVDLSGGRSDTSDNAGYEVGGAFLNEISGLLTNMNLDPKSCSQKVLCAFGAQFSKNIPGLLDIVSRIDMLEKILNANQVLNAMKTQTCEETFTSCKLLSTNLLSYAPYLLQMV